MGDINYCTTGWTYSAVAGCTVFERPPLLYWAGLDEMIKIWLKTKNCVTCTHTRKSSRVRTDLHVMENVTATDVSTGHSHKSHLAARFDKFSCAFVAASRWSSPISSTWHYCVSAETRGWPAKENRGQVRRSEKKLQGRRDKGSQWRSILVSLNGWSLSSLGNLLAGCWSPR